MAKEMYQKIDEWDDKLKPCPFCGSRAELWQYTPDSEMSQKVAMCANHGDDEYEEECPMYMPPNGFYKATKREAAEIWNKRLA